MADSISRVRTNYFKVKNEDDLLKLISECATSGSDGTVHCWTRAGKDGEKTYAFGCEGNLLGFPYNDEEDGGDYNDYDYNGFIAKLQKLLPNGEAIIITKVVFEKLNYVHGGVHVITNTESAFKELCSIGNETARTLLNDEEWVTENEY